MNTATWSELRAALPGVGEVLAKRIVAYREEHGPFADLAELARVPGFGARAVTRLTDHARAVPRTRQEMLSAYPAVGLDTAHAASLDEAAAAYERVSTGEGIFVERISPVSMSMLPGRTEPLDGGAEVLAPAESTEPSEPERNEPSAAASAGAALWVPSPSDSGATSDAPATQGVFSHEVWEASAPVPAPALGALTAVSSDTGSSDTGALTAGSLNSGPMTQAVHSHEVWEAAPSSVSGDVSVGRLTQDVDSHELWEERPPRSFVDATSLVPEPPSHLAIEPYRGPSLGSDADRDLLGTRLSDVRLSELEPVDDAPSLPPSEYDEPPPPSVSEPMGADLYVGGALFRESRLPTTDAELRISLRDAADRGSSLAETPTPVGVDKGATPSAAPKPTKRTSQAIPVPAPAPAKQAANSNGWSQLAAVAALALAIGLGGAWLGAKRAASNEVNRVSNDMIDVKTNVDTVRTDVDTLKDRVTALTSATARTEQRFSEQELRNAAVDARLTKAEDDSRALEKTAKVVEEKAKRAEERSETSAARLQKVEDEMTWQRMLTESKIDSLRLRVRQAADDLESVAPRKQPKVASSNEGAK